MTVNAHGGVMFRVDGELCFLPASIAVKVMPTPELAHVPGGPPELRGIGLVDGEMIPVVQLGRARAFDPRAEGAISSRSPKADASRAMLVCRVLGERVGLVGMEVVATGRFDVDPASGEVELGGERAHPFDVAALIARVREARWAV